MSPRDWPASMPASAKLQDPRQSQAETVLGALSTDHAIPPPHARDGRPEGNLGRYHNSEYPDAAGAPGPEMQRAAPGWPATPVPDDLARQCEAAPDRAARHWPGGSQRASRQLAGYGPGT
jgi:hypothetical protein